jgi:hypothetical protein
MKKVKIHSRTSPVVSLQRITDVQFAKGHTKLFSFGNNMYGQLGVGKSKHDSPSAEQVLETTPNLVDGIDGNITHIACGLDNTVFSTGESLHYFRRVMHLLVVLNIM